MANESKRFEEWEEVDCNECTHYWDSSCDAVKQDDRRQCNSFLATRRVVIPARLNALEKRWQPPIPRPQPTLTVSGINRSS
jgi:hypothetical protein